MEESVIRKIFYFKNYYLDFFNELNADVQKKFNWTLKLISEVERVPVKYLKYIKGSKGIYEIRVESGSNIYRVFCFLIKGRLLF